MTTNKLTSEDLEVEARAHTLETGHDTFMSALIPTGLICQGGDCEWQMFVGQEVAP